jgi:hypothetical protein
MPLPIRRLELPHVAAELMNGRTQMRKTSLVAVCPECGVALCSEPCWSCDGTAASWISICEECGGRGQLLLCPNRACHSPPPPDFWRASRGQLSNPRASCCIMASWGSIGMSSTNTYIVPLAMLAIALMLVAAALWL